MAMTIQNYDTEDGRIRTWDVAMWRLVEDEYSSGWSVIKEDEWSQTHTMTDRNDIATLIGINVNDDINKKLKLYHDKIDYTSIISVLYNEVQWIHLYLAAIQFMSCLPISPLSSSSVCKMSTFINTFVCKLNLARSKFHWPILYYLFLLIHISTYDIDQNWHLRHPSREWWLRFSSYVLFDSRADSLSSYNIICQHL